MIDYKKKYLKYKNKYIELKDSLDETDPNNILINIHGPVSFSFFNITDKINGKNKKILLFGDKHRKYSYDDNYFSLENLIKLIKEKVKEDKNCLDFFIENTYDNIQMGGNKVSNILMNELNASGPE